MTDVDGEAIEREIGEAISSVINQHQGAMVVKFLALVEIIRPDGAPSLWTLGSPGLTEWDTVGLLGHGMHIQQGRTMANQIEAE